MVVRVTDASPRDAITSHRHIFQSGLAVVQRSTSTDLRVTLTDLLRAVADIAYTVLGYFHRSGDAVRLN